MNKAASLGIKYNADRDQGCQLCWVLKNLLLYLLAAVLIFQHFMASGL
ncbi:hypothetical protein MTMBA_06670 [Moorella thermoacetica]